MPTGDINVCIEEASAFLSVAKKLNEEHEIVELTKMIYPLVVNASFSCELSLKAIAMARSKDSSFEAKHELKDLFENLEEKDHNKLEAKCKDALNIGFHEALSEFSNAFTDWRYAFEKRVGTHPEELLKLAEVFLGYAKEVAGQ